MSNPRPSWDQYFMQIATLVATRSTCTLRSVGAVLVKDRRILATGYNGSLPGAPHCDEAGCNLDEAGRCQNVVHAEQNIVLQAARHGISIIGTTLYCTHRPCARCTVLIAASGIKQIYYTGDAIIEEHCAGVLNRAHVQFEKVSP